jgi:hypothetical protein
MKPWVKKHGYHQDVATRRKNKDSMATRFRSGEQEQRVCAERRLLCKKQENCKVENLREGEAPAEPKGLQNTAQQELCPPMFAFHNDSAILLRQAVVSPLITA